MRWWIAHALVVLVACGVVACGDDGGVGSLADAPPSDPLASSDCAIDLRVTGGIDATVAAADDNAACASQLSAPPTDDIEVAFIPVRAGPRVDVVVAGLMPGQLGMFSAELALAPAESDHRGTCEAAISEHTAVGPGPGELDDTSYRVRARVTCSAALVSATAEPVTVERLEWVAHVNWLN